MWPLLKDNKAFVLKELIIGRGSMSKRIKEKIRMKNKGHLEWVWLSEVHSMQQRCSMLIGVK